jgi:N-succinyldiaminopimelate aminotransferase
MNPNLNSLHPYPFEKLAQLKAGCEPPKELAHIALSIGEPKHEPPSFVIDALRSNLDKVSHYAATKGCDEMRQAIAQWANTRFRLNNTALLDFNTQVLPVNGTREALFAFAQCVIDRGQDAAVLMPNPFYQIYEGAAFLAGAEAIYLNCTEENNFYPKLDTISEFQWQRCQLVYLCSPGNPTGAVLSAEYLSTLIELADQYDFVIASDECYSELYFDEMAPPLGILEHCANIGRDNYARCVAFHSLSKRSNLPGLRSGFVAGDSTILKKFLLYRTYHGCAMPMQTQLASIAAWQDEDHVKANRDLYRLKFKKVSNILKGVLDFELPDAGFYLWPRTPISDTEFAQQLFATQNVTVLPGSYLSRGSNDNPGAQRVRMALVAELESCVEAANRIKQFVENQC